MAIDVDVRELRLAFRALGDLTRLRILRELSMTDHISVTDMALLLRMSQPLLSWHLGILRRARLITNVRAGRQVFCSLNRRRMTEVEDMLNAFLGGRLAGEAAAVST